VSLAAPLAAAALVFLAGSAAGQYSPFMGLGEGDGHTILVVSPAGVCTLTNEAVHPRKSLELQVNSWKRYSARSEGVGPDDEEPAVEPAKAARKPLTDVELAAGLREMFQQQSETGEDTGMKVETVEVMTNNVRVVTSRTFASLQELLSQNPYTWGPGGLAFDDARLALDTNRNLSLTFTPNQNTARYAKTLGRQWKAAKMKFDWKLVLPGKILSSGLPGTEGNTTWLSVDSEKPETIEAAVKLAGLPLVITAEPGGLKLDEPLESKKLAQTAWRQRKAEPDLPITEATAGYLAEPVGLTLSTVHLFAEGEKYFKGRPDAMMYGLGSTGTVISAKLFPPKGREIRSVSGVKVKAAKDDQGRPIPGIAESGDNNEESDAEFRSFDAGGAEKGGARIELHLSLPAPDAKTIESVDAEAVAITIGGWKEMALTNVQADAKKEIDLGEVLPGAKLTVNKIGGRKPQRTVDATLTGPKAVSQLEVKVKMSSRRGGQSSANDRRPSKTTGNQTTRHLTIQSYEFEMGEAANTGPLTLLVRYPQDVKRERVPFKLTALDLL